MPDSQPLVTLSTGSLYTYGLSRVFGLVRDSGFDGVELIVDERWDTRQVAYLRFLSEETGVRIWSLHAPFRHFPSMGKDYPDALHHTIALAENLGARTIVIHPTTPMHVPFDRWLLQNLNALQAQTKVVLTVENMPRRKSRWLWLFQADRHPYWQPEVMDRFPALTLDTAHCGVSGVDPVVAWQQLQPKVRHIHLSDGKGEEEHLFPGEGVLPLPAFLSQVAHSTFAGIIVVELHPPALHAGAPDSEVHDRIQQAAAFCRTYLQAAAVSAVGSQKGA
jgi:sugar phosphate isomerase/epimerase